MVLILKGVNFLMPDKTIHIYRMDFYTRGKFILFLMGSSFIIGACIRLGWEFVENFKVAVGFFIK